jgi:transposase
MRPTPNADRENIVRAKQRGEKREAIALWFNVSVSTVDKVCRLHREKGTVAPQPYRGRIVKGIDGEKEEIRKAIEENSDITLEEIIEKLSLRITVSGLWRRISKMGFTFKKNIIPRRAEARGCPDSQGGVEGAAEGIRCEQAGFPGREQREHGSFKALRQGAERGEGQWLRSRCQV